MDLDEDVDVDVEEDGIVDMDRALTGEYVCARKMFSPPPKKHAPSVFAKLFSLNISPTSSSPLVQDGLCC